MSLLVQLSHFAFNRPAAVTRASLLLYLMEAASQLKSLLLRLNTGTRTSVSQAALTLQFFSKMIATIRECCLVILFITFSDLWMLKRCFNILSCGYIWKNHLMSKVSKPHIWEVFQSLLVSIALHVAAFRLCTFLTVIKNTALVAMTFIYCSQFYLLFFFLLRRVTFSFSRPKKNLNLIRNSNSLAPEVLESLQAPSFSESRVDPSEMHAGRLAGMRGTSIHL